jgi:leucyl aminopeptidase
MTKIAKHKSGNTHSSVCIVTTTWKKDTTLPLSKHELDYLEQYFKDKEKKSITFNSHGKIVSVILVDTSKNVNAALETCRKHGASVADAANAINETTLEIIAGNKLEKCALAVAEGAALGNYQFIHHKPSAKKQHNTLSNIGLKGNAYKESDILHLNVVVDATIKARNLVNEPVNHLNAAGLANAFKQMGKEAGFKVEVYNKAKIKQLKMGGLLAVNAGSVDEPTFSIMEYKPKNAKNKKPYVLVGKGIVYDTGGLSLKPTPNSMDSMKCDMAGAAAVGCAMYAIAKAKLNVHVIALVPATDNRPGFNAFAPGDIITMMDGSTVEMLNSDAEGRMILADALHFAKRYTPELTIDVATLTGAAVAAIGLNAIVSMGNASEKYTSKLKEAGYAVHERLAEMPFWDDYNELLKSDIADQKNLGGPYAGSITAGKFLEKFTDYPYYHLDIAGPAFLNARDGYRTKGGTGVGVRLFFEFFQSL